MAKTIEPKLRKIGDYLRLEDDTIFVIPEYQRPYSWGMGNCDKLWQDIVDFADSDSKDKYFLGTIIINCHEDDTKYDLIDGQQRTTTFLLLLKALLVRINVAIGQMFDDEEAQNLRNGLLERRRKIMGILYKAEPENISDKPDGDKDAKIYGSDLILKNNSINELYKQELSTILKADDYVTAEKNVVKIKYKQKDNRYTNFFRNFKFFYNKVSELSESQINTIAKTFIDKCEVIEIKSWQVEQAITMFNSLNSDGMPLRDADIISAKLYTFAKGCGKENEFKNLWIELVELTNKLSGMGVVNIDSILMQQMYYIRAKNKEILSDTGSINVTTPGLRRYFTEINKDILKTPIEFCKGMINLAKIWEKVSSYPVTQILLKFNENTKLFVASYFYRFDADKLTEKDVIPLMESFMKLFAILELVDVGYSSRKFKTFLFGEEVKLVDKNVAVESICGDFAEHIRNEWSPEIIKNEILDYDGNMLVYLNEYLFAKEKDVKFVVGKNDIEHIMPYSGNNLQEIRKDAGINDKDEFKEIVNKLGNKILLEEKINRAIGNEWFRTKVSTKLVHKTGYLDSEYPIATYLVQRYHMDSKPYWKKDDIIKATEKASERIVKFIFEE